MPQVESLVDPVLQEDLEAIATKALTWSELNGKTILVTGATGLIGSQIVKAIACWNRKFAGATRVLAFVRSPAKVRQVFADILDRPEISIVHGDLRAGIAIASPVDFVIHCASITSSSDFVNRPVETIQTATDGTRAVLELAREKQVEGFVFLSSFEVYGMTDPKLEVVTESDFGYLDPMRVRSSYAESKRLAECLCASYAAQYALPVKVARLSQTFGPGIAHDDGRVFAQFARSVMEQSDIVLRTTGETVRNYCYTGDAVAALLLLLVKGAPGEAYNVANPATAISIRDMAELVAARFPQAGIKVVFDLVEDVAKLGYNPTMKIRLHSGKLQHLGWQASCGLGSMFERTIRSLSHRQRQMLSVTQAKPASWR